MSNQPPIEVPQGAIRLNTDSQKLEFFAQDRWYEMATNTPTLDGGSRGLAYRAGGSNQIDFITIPTAGNATDFGDATTSAGGRHTAASRTRSIAAGGGTPTRINTIEFSTFSSTGNGQDFGDLTVVGAGGAQMGMSNQTRGVFGGRTSPSNVNTIDFITIAQTGNAVDFGDQGNTTGGMNCFSSPTRGVMGGGHPGLTPRIEFITIASTGNSQEFGSLIHRQELSAAASSSTRGVWMGGRYAPSATVFSSIQFVQIQSLGDSIDFGDLTSTRNDSGGMSDCVRAVCYGGSGSDTDIIEYISISTGGTAVDFGNAQGSAGYACNSNGHGGL